MLNRSVLAGLLAALLVLGAAIPVAAAPAGLRATDAAAYHGRLIVTWKGAAPSSLHMAGVQGVSPTSRPMRSVVVADDGQAAMLAARLRNDPRVLAVVPDAKLAAMDWPADGTPNDPRYPEQADHAQVGVPTAWQTTIGDPSVIVAVIDSGVDLAHPDLDGVTIVAPRDEVWNGTDVTDELGHGTEVAGTIVAEANNGEGIAGIAPGSALMPIKLMDEFGFLSLSDALDAVDWARIHGADIINMSFSGLLTPAQVALAQPTFTAAREAGILLVAAAGNEGISLRNYPASFTGVISVGAVDGEDEIAPFSTTGKALDVVAPGVDVLSTLSGGGYDVDSGTSFASPRVAAIAALVWAARPGLSVAALEAVLRASVVDLGAPGRDSIYGDGRIDAAAALVAPVPDPLPDLEPPAALPALTLKFAAPTGTVRQFGSSYTVRIALNHEVEDSMAMLGRWPIDRGRCNDRAPARVKMLDFGPTIALKGLRKGSCYRVYAAAMDEDGNYAEAMSAAILVLDRTIPTVTRRTPKASATGVNRSASVRVRFSEAVSAPAGSIRLRNLDTGLIVRATIRYVASTHTVVVDPVLRMYPRTRYRVEVTNRVQDRYGNPTRAANWTFRTGR